MPTLPPEYGIVPPGWYAQAVAHYTAATLNARFGIKGSPYWNTGIEVRAHQFYTVEDIAKRRSPRRFGKAFLRWGAKAARQYVSQQFARAYQRLGSTPSDPPVYNQVRYKIRPYELGPSAQNYPTSVIGDGWVRDPGFMGPTIAPELVGGPLRSTWVSDAIVFGAKFVYGYGKGLVDVFMDPDFEPVGMDQLMR